MRKYLQSIKFFSKNNPSWSWDLILLTLVLTGLYLIGLGSYPLFVPDEGRYTEIAREMFSSGDFILPHLNGVVFLDKPILYYWLEVTAIKIFGLNEFALRFWPAIIGVWGCLVAYIGGRNLFSRASGIISACGLATAIMYFGAAHYANLDLEVAVFISTTLVFLFLGIKNSNPKHAKLWIYAGYIFTGIAILTKGIIGIAFPALIIGSWIIITGNTPVIKRLHLISGLVLTTIVAAPWYVAAQIADKDFFHFFFVVQHISRFLSTATFNNITPWWFYIPITFAGCLPWTILIVHMLLCTIKNCIKNPQAHETEIYLLLWAALILLFFSVPHSKTIGYILPIFPPLFILFGNYVTENWSNFIIKQHAIAQWGVPLTYIILAISCIITIQYYTPALPAGLSNRLAIAGLGFCFIALVLVYLNKKRLLGALYLINLVAAITICLYVVSSAAIINTKTKKSLAMTIKQQLKPEDEVVNFYEYFQDLALYLERKLVIVADWNNPNIALNDNWLRELWYGKSFQQTDDWLINEQSFWQRWGGTKKIYVAAHKRYLSKFIAHKSPCYVLQQHQDIVLLSNHKS